MCSFQLLSKRESTGSLRQFSSASEAGLLELKPAAGMTLWLRGSTTDLSGLDNNAVTASGFSPPTAATGFDNRPALRFDSGQELNVPVFLNSATAATLYMVWSPNRTQYLALRTNEIDAYWRFSDTSGPGYFAVFRSSRLESYPSSVPASGNHLISIHSKSDSYEIFINGVSAGIRSGAFSVGDRFRIGFGGASKTYIGDISEIIVYPTFVNPESDDHLLNLAYAKQRYPSLALTLS